MKEVFKKNGDYPVHIQEQVTEPKQFQEAIEGLMRWKLRSPQVRVIISGTYLITDEEREKLQNTDRQLNHRESSTSALGASVILGEQGEVIKIEGRIYPKPKNALEEQQIIQASRVLTDDSIRRLADEKAIQLEARKGKPRGWGV